MSRSVSRETTAGRIYQDLRNQARREKRPGDELMLLYALERFLYRVTQSSYADRLVLKGGLLLAAFELRRPTRDVDMVGSLDNDEGTIRTCIDEVVSLDLDDGVTFKPEELTIEIIRDEDPYPGLRVRLPAYISRAQLKLTLDFNFGDPIVPAAERVTYPSVLTDGDAFSVLAYPLTAVLGEKIETMVRRGDANTRERDFADVARIIRREEISGDQMRSALEATAEFRVTELRPLSEVLVTLGTARQTAWTAYRERVGETVLSEDFSVVVGAVIAFADPIITGDTVGARWSPTHGRWQPLS